MLHDVLQGRVQVRAEDRGEEVGALHSTIPTNIPSVHLVMGCPSTPEQVLKY